MPKWVLLFCLLNLQYIVGQNPYPQDYFRNPLDIPLVLAGTFAELRSNHFHAGMDIKTQQREGLEVFAAAEGYVSRIKIAHWGYGKALYITHPNGYVSVYAHLQKFSQKIESYIKKQQYEKESYEIEVFPDIDELPITKDEIVALTGNTGSSAGPHLHFELRDKSERPINPMLFGIDVKDTRKPKVYGVFAYPIDSQSHINDSNDFTELRLIPLDNGNYKVENVNAYGKIGFGIVTNDQLDYAPNKNGVTNIQTYYNGNKNFEIDFKRFSFDETKHINRLIDYSYYKKHKDRIQKLFLESNNPLSLYKNINQDGYIHIEDSTANIYRIKISDFKNNETWVSIEVNGEVNEAIIPKDIKTTNHYIYSDQATTLESENISAYFPKNTFYDDLFVDFKTNCDTLTLHNSSVPTQKYFYINYDISNYDKSDKDKLFIARLNDYNDKKTYVSTIKKGNILSTRTNVLGTYAIVSDLESPKITPINFQNKKWISKLTHLKIKIEDELSGISNYRATINGKWILMEYNAKKNILVYNFDDKIINDSSENNLKLIITDNVGNSSTFEATFYRKI